MSELQTVDNSTRCRRCPKIIPGPRAVSNIVLNELCERFAFYASRAILVLYINEGLGYGEDTAISLYSYFMAACYFSPLIGGYIADVLLGKYRTIVIFNIIYLCGLISLCSSAFFTNAAGSFVGLLLIALGTGGIKPCIAPFGAEQLGNATDEQRTSFFFVFYFSINVGSVFSYILTPIVRERAGFAPAFSLALGVFFFSYLVFLQGSASYTKIPPSGTSAYSKMYHVLRAAFCQRRGDNMMHEKAPLIDSTANSTAVKEDALAAADNTASSSSNGTHAALSASQLGCLKGATGRVPQDDIHGAAAVLNILPLLLMLPVFWAIFDSQGSVWTLQRKHMNNCMFGDGVPCLTPEQLGALNPLCIVLLVPLFDKVILPFLRRLNIQWLQPTALRRMAVGMQIAVCSFILTWAVQTQIDNHPDKTVSAWLQLPQFFVISFAEVLVSATGLEWAYSQSPPNMRGTIVAFYHAMVAIGNLLTGVLFDALAGSLTQAQIILLLAGLLCVAGILFAFLAHRYRKIAVPEKTEEPNLKRTAASSNEA